MVPEAGELLLVRASLWALTQQESRSASGAGQKKQNVVEARFAAAHSPGEI